MINRGTIVILMSGGPRMTALGPPNEASDVRCVWFSADGFRQEAFFPRGVLIVVPDQILGYADQSPEFSGDIPD